MNKIFFNEPVFPIFILRIFVPLIRHKLKDYDVFIERNIRKGCSSNDLNINGHHLKVKIFLVFYLLNNLFFERKMDT